MVCRRCHHGTTVYLTPLIEKFGPDCLVAHLAPKFRCDECGGGTGRRRAHRYGNRYAYGHVVEDDRHLIVSGGLGCSVLPVRIGMPPEIVMVDVNSSNSKA